MKDKTPTPLLIIAVVVVLFLMATHTKELNGILGITAAGGETSIDVGSYHYYEEGA